MRHYFTNDHSLKQNRREITFRFLSSSYTLMSDDGIFSKDGLDTGTEVLLKVLLDKELTGPVADLGSGLGVIGVILSAYQKDLVIDGFDINERTVELAKINYKRYQVKGTIYNHDGIKGSYQTIISNPPIRVGKEKLYQLFENVATSLESGASFYFVMRKQHGAKSAQKKCLELFGNCQLLKKDYGFYVYRCIKD